MTDDSMFSIKDAGTMVGLEVHQQLATDKKLFCGCPPAESEQYTIKFQRRLRASRGELGKTDAAALFESAKSNVIMYLASPASSCLVEQDEEPPHDLDADAKKTALIISAALRSSVFGEIFPMRKTVIDGSNTSGFQRTMLISQGGYYEACGMRIGIQSVCLEEDAAKNLGDEGSTRRYGLERLGIPLVEIATEPFEAEPGRVRDVALALGRILRGTKRVRRGLGSIRQDVNVSIRDGGAVIEVKGVQQLDQLEKVVEYEARRQHGLLKISGELQKRGWPDHVDYVDVTDIMACCESKIVQKAVADGQRIFGATFENMAGMFGFAPHDGIRLGREVAELVRFFGIGGIFHSDELPNYGITESDVDRARQALNATDNDAFLMLAAPAEKIDVIIRQIASRISYIGKHGIPADTRLATQAGETRFLRPRPGAARMYPETDILPVTISNKDLADAQDCIPRPWEEEVREFQEKYKLNAQLTGQIFDSEYIEIFEKVCETTKSSPNFVASTLCSTITNLERQGLDKTRLTMDVILRIFALLSDKVISKESVEMIIDGIMSGKDPEQVIREASGSTLSDAELDEMLEQIVNENMDIVNSQGERASGPLMGIAMKSLRGRASGEKISKRLGEKIRNIL